MKRNTGAFIVTGGSSGIGLAVLNGIAPLFKSKHVLNLDVQIGIDVRDYPKVLEAMKRCIQEEEVNYLFAGAGVVFFTDPNNGNVVDFASAPIDQLHTMVDINLKGQINVLHAFLSVLREKRASGNIVLVSSISAFHSGGPNMAVYDATKAAISALAKRLVPYRNIRINTIAPGSVRTNIGAWNTDFSENMPGRKIVKGGQDGDQRRLGKEVSLAQIVSIARFLFFADHGMNGAELVVDEGLTLAGREDY